MLEHCFVRARLLIVLKRKDMRACCKASEQKKRFGRHPKGSQLIVFWFDFFQFSERAVLQVYLIPARKDEKTDVDPCHKTF